MVPKVSARVLAPYMNSLLGQCNMADAVNASVAIPPGTTHARINGTVLTRFDRRAQRNIATNTEKATKENAKLAATASARKSDENAQIPSREPLPAEGWYAAADAAIAHIRNPSASPYPRAATR